MEMILVFLAGMIVMDVMWAWHSSNDVRDVEVQTSPS